MEGGMRDNSEHENVMLEMVKEHCDVQQNQDKIQIVDALRSAMNDLEKTVDSLYKLTRKARLEGYKLGRSTVQKD